MGIGFRDSAAFAVLPCRDGRQFPWGAGENVAVAFLQVFVLAGAECFAFAVGDFLAGLLEQPLDVFRAGVTVGLDDEGQLAEKMRYTQAMATVVIGEIGCP